MQNEQFGRSMIEMLGVLSIVGILSVGGIAGFSKAMAKYRMIKFKEKYMYFVQEVLQYDKTWTKERARAGVQGNTQFALASLIARVGLLPQHWEQKDVYIYDDVGGKHYISKGLQNMEFQYSITYSEMSRNSESKQRCLTLMLDVLKQMDNIYFISLWKNNTRYGNLLYGKDYCNQKTQVCFAEMDVAEIYEYCSVCEKNKTQCYIVYYFK